MCERCAIISWTSSERCEAGIAMEMRRRKLKLAVLGFGNAGQAFAKLLLDKT